MKERRIWVIGGANIDIIGISHHSLKDYDSNIGTIRTLFGGVGRNIAEACAELGEKVNLVTCFGCDDYGHLLKEHCARLGIDTSYSIESQSHNTSVYLAILDENRDMRIGMNDMSILSEIDENVLSRALQAMTNDDIMVMDSNLNEELVDYIVSNSPAEIASDPVSAAKISRLERVLGRIGIFKPNAIESEALTGIEILDDESAKKSLDWFSERGVEEIIITLGARGILLGYEGDRIWYTHKTVEMSSANGGGDALFGAYLSRRIRGEDPREAIKFAMAAAILKISGEYDWEADDEECVIFEGLESRHLRKEQLIMEKKEAIEIKERKL